MHEMRDWYKCQIPRCQTVQLYASMISSHYQDMHNIQKSIKEVVSECKISDDSQITKLTEEKIKDEKMFNPNENELCNLKCNQGIIKHKKGSIFSQVDQQTDDSILKITDHEYGRKIMYQCPYCDFSSDLRKKTLLHATAVHKMKWFKVGSTVN